MAERAAAMMSCSITVSRDLASSAESGVVVLRTYVAHSGCKNREAEKIVPATFGEDRWEDMGTWRQHRASQYAIDCLGPNMPYVTISLRAPFDTQDCVLKSASWPPIFFS